MSGIEQGLVDLARAANDFWALDVVTAAAWHHSTRPGCLGFTFTTNGSAFCGNCGWEVTSRRPDPQFAMLTLGRIGQTFAIAQEVAEAYVKFLGGYDVRLDGAGSILYSVDVPEGFSFTHRIDL